MMKILFVIESVNGYGAEKMLAWVANSMALRGFQVAVYTYRKDACPVQWVDGVTFISPESDRRIPVANLRRFIKQWRPDCIVPFKLDANVFATLAALGTGIPVVVCDRLDPYTPGYWKLKLTKPLFRFAGAAVCQLDKVRDYYRSVINGPIAVIPNPVIPVDCLVDQPFAQRRNEIACIGRLDLLNKRQDVLIKAFALAKDRLPADTVVDFYGTGQDEAKVRKMCEDAGIADRCRFLGKVSQPYHRYKNAKLFVLPSDHEGIPNALIEALSIGMTCISTDMSPGGARLLIDDGKNGLLVPAGDSEAMARAIVRCFDDPDLADTMSHNARSIEQTFSQDKIADMWADFFKTLIADRKHNVK